MPRYKYPPELLAEAAARSRSIAEVLRALGVRISGGSHAHISRQLKRFDIDTSHFTGSAHNRGRTGNRRPSADLLTIRPPGSYRTPGFRLRRALTAIGVPELCASCGVGPVWQGAPLVLHVDHISGDFLDNRPANLRLLCPNCHSQTATYAGRARSAATPDRRGTPSGGTVDPTGPAAEDMATLVRQVSAGRLTTVEAARRLGCTRDHVGMMRRRFEATGSISPPPRPRKTGASAPPTKQAGPTTPAARRSRLSGSAGVA